MELKNFLIDALKEQFKAEATVRAIEKEIVIIAECATFDKYKKARHSEDEIEFELIGVKAKISTYNKFDNFMVDLILSYVCKSPVSKEKREKIESVKANYSKTKYLEWCNYKITLWKENIYHIPLEHVLSGKIDLVIMNKTIIP